MAFLKNKLIIADDDHKVTMVIKLQRRWLQTYIFELSLFFLVEMLSHFLEPKN